MAKAKKAARRAAKKTARGVRRYDDNQRIIVLAKSNPRRPKTVQHKRFETILKHRNKTVGLFRQHGGDTTALRYAVHGGHARVK